MGTYRVKAGKKIGQNGVDFGEFDVLTIPDAVAAGLLDRIEPCDADGRLTNMPDQTDYQASLMSARSHERITLIEQEVQRRRDWLALAEQELESEKKRLQASSPKTKDAPDAPAAPPQTAPKSLPGGKR